MIRRRPTKKPEMFNDTQKAFGNKVKEKFNNFGAGSNIGKAGAKVIEFLTPGKKAPRFPARKRR